MHALTLIADTGGAGPIEQIARTFGVDWPHLIAQMISFGIVCALLHRFAYRPVLAMLAERRQRIAEGLGNAAKSKAQLAQTEDRCRELLAQADARAARLMDEARAAAATVAEQEKQKAIVAAEQIRAAACAAAEYAHDRMLAELKGEMGRLVVQTTMAVIGKVITPDDQRRLIEDTAAQFAS
jgi:F-type H+-transporting ATPase subunit b